MSENKSGSITANKAFDFAKRIVKLYNFLCAEKKEFTLSKQLERSGTAIGANVFEAQQAQSKKDYLSKMNIALKEAVETEYWLKLLFESDYIDDKQYDSINRDCIELNKLLISIVKTTKLNLKMQLTDEI